MAGSASIRSPMARARPTATSSASSSSRIRRAARSACTTRCARATCSRSPSRATIFRCAATRPGRCSSPAASASRRCWPWRRRCTIPACRTNCTISRRASDHLAFPDRLDALTDTLIAASRPRPATRPARSCRRAAVGLPCRHASSICVALARCSRPRGGSRPTQAGPTKRCISNISRTPRDRRQLELRGGAGPLLP